MLLKIVCREAFIPLIASISYEIIRLTVKYDNSLTTIISLPAMLLQKLTTREPDRKMVEVAIVAVEAVFDWKTYIAQMNQTEENEEVTEEVVEETTTEAETEIEAETLEENETVDSDEEK